MPHRPDTSRSSGTVTEVMFEVTSGAYPFVEVSRAVECRLTLERLVPQSDGDYLEVFRLSGAPPRRVAELDDDGVQPQLLGEDDGEALLEFQMSGEGVAVSLADHGAIPQEMGAEHGEGWVIAGIPPAQDIRAVLDAFLDEHPEAELKARREREPSNSLASAEGIESIECSLTDAETEVLQAAHDLGYFQWPNYSAGENVADELGMDENEFYDHFYAAQRKLLGELFDGALPRGGGQSHQYQRS